MVGFELGAWGPRARSEDCGVVGIPEGDVDRGWVNLAKSGWEADAGGASVVEAATSVHCFNEIGETARC